MSTLSELGHLPSTAKHTAEFVKMLNDMFDLLNSRNPACGSVSAEDLPKFKVFKEECKQWTAAGKRPPCFEALVQNLTGMEMLIESLLQSQSFDYVLTGRVTQDCLENFFAQVRSRGGNRSNPSAAEFSYAYKALAANLLLTPVKSGNCEVNSDDLLLDLAGLGKGVKTTKKTLPVPVRGDSVSVIEVETIDDFVVSKPVTNVITYIAGYVLQKLDIRSRCAECFALLTDNGDIVEDCQLLTHYKVYRHSSDGAFGSLCMPSRNVTEFLTRVEKIFNKEIQSLICSSHVLRRLQNQIQNEVPSVGVTFCSNHLENVFLNSITTLYLRCRLHYHFRFETRKLFEEKKKPNKKLTILKHK
jgi:hypothetical protein